MIISVIIPNHNGRRFLPPCLEALSRSDLPPGVELEVIVVDNGSTDGSPELLASYGWVRSLIFPKGLGFARANNQARAVARGEVVCFLNNDTTVEPGWLRRPLEVLAGDPTVAATGSKLLYMHSFVPVVARLPTMARVFVSSRIFGGPMDSKVHWGSLPRGHVQGSDGFWLSEGDRIFLPVRLPALDPPQPREPVLNCLAVSSSQPVRVGFSWSGQPPHHLDRLPGVIPLPPLDTLKERVRLIQNAGGKLDDQAQGGDAGTGEVEDGGRYSKEEIVPSLCGAALFVRRSDLDQVGWFPEAYGMYYEDTDLCVRLRLLGKRLVFCPSSRVNHYHTGTTREWSPFFIENVTRSSSIFIARHGRWPLVRQQLRRVGVRTARAVLRLGVRGSAAWNQEPELRGTLRSIPGIFDALTDRLRAGTVPTLALPRQPYHPRSQRP